MISLAAFAVACLVGVGVLMALYGSRRISIPGPTELRTNLRQADRVLALQFPSENTSFKRLRRWLNRGGLHDVATVHYLVLIRKISTHSINWGAERCLLLRTNAFRLSIRRSTADFNSDIS